MDSHLEAETFRLSGVKSEGSRVKMDYSAIWLIGTLNSLLFTLY